MAHAGPAEAHTAAYPLHPLQNIINHRKLVATIFPRSADEATIDVAAAAAVDNKEICHCAASQGALSAVLALLAYGKCSCDLPDRFGRTPLHWAAEQAPPGVACALLNVGACVDPLSQRKNTPILLAASRGHLEAVRVLLLYRAGESDCWPLTRHSRGIGHWRSTALHCAAAGGHVRVVEALVDAGFDWGQHDRAGLTPAEVSARQSRYTSAAVMHLLLPTRDMGGKLLHDYVNMAMQDVAMISGLVNGGAFFDWQDGTGEAPFHRAVRFNHVAISRVLLHAGADANIRDHEVSSPLHMAACAGHGEIVADLLEAGADLEPLSVGGDCPPQRAVVQNRANVVSLLLSAGASTEHRDAMYGQTPLSWACQGCLAPMVRVLVEAGADIESKYSAGLTPPHWACRFTDTESVEVLLNAGADPGAVNLAAADDAVEVSPSRSGRSVSKPVAIDVIGIGFPLDRMKDSRSPLSRRISARRLYVVSVQRIELALHAAQRDNFWRRRGWLVILANRHFATGVPGVRGERTVFCRVDCGPSHPALAQLRHVDTGLEQPMGAHQKGAAGYRVDANLNGESSDSEHPQTRFCHGQDHVGKRPTNVDSVPMVARTTFCQNNQTRGDIGGHDNVAVRLPELVAALLRLAAVKVGVFRRVVMFFYLRMAT